MYSFAKNPCGGLRLAPILKKAFMVAKSLRFHNLIEDVINSKQVLKQNRSPNWITNCRTRTIPVYHCAIIPVFHFRNAYPAGKDATLCLYISRAVFGIPNNTRLVSIPESTISRDITGRGALCPVSQINTFFV